MSMHQQSFNSSQSNSPINSSFNATSHQMNAIFCAHSHAPSHNHFDWFQFDTPSIKLRTVFFTRTTSSTLSREGRLQRNGKRLHWAINKTCNASLTRKSLAGTNAICVQRLIKNVCCVCKQNSWKHDGLHKLPGESSMDDPSRRSFNIKSVETECAKWKFIVKRYTIISIRNSPTNSTEC